MKFIIRYKRAGKDQAKDFECATPITALNQFHYFMQRVMEFGPKDYELVSLSSNYNENAYGQPVMKESLYDIPKCANPDVRPRPQHTNETPAMGFFSSTEGQGKLAE